MKIFIVHYLPLEFYPPVINFLNQASARIPYLQVCTTRAPGKRKQYLNNAVRLFRYALPGTEFVLWRLLKYFSFNAGVLLRLIRIRPERILYFETHSSYPVYLYKRYFNRKVQVYIHCHEYYSPDWYKKYAWLLRYYHSKETGYLYARAKWISHTNKKRLELFRQDHPFLKMEQMKVLANYPPANWVLKNKKQTISGLVRCVYIGSLSLETTYIKEFCDWVIAQRGKVTADIYSFNIDSATENFLDKLNVDYIRFFREGIEYEKIPDLLQQYQVGLMLYKAHTLNVKYCAPNKLFEYLSCDLDVWFSDVMIGCHEFISTDHTPKVLSIDMTRMDEFDYKQAIARDGLPRKFTAYTCETELQPLIEDLLAENL